MSDDLDTPPGPLLASGRAADVYDIGDQRVLRRYRRPSEGLAEEIATMRWVADHGVRVPRVLDHPAAIRDRDLVMERIDGPTMLEDLAQRPWRVAAAARQLARLQRDIAGVPAADWMVASSGPIVPTGDSVLHLDLHPMNVIMSADGPVVIDWTNATGGPPGLDAALSYVEMSAYEIESTRDRIAQEVMVRVFKRSRGPAMIDAYLVAACERRLADRNITPGERTKVAEIRRRALAST